MSTKIIDGKQLAQKVLSELAQEIQRNKLTPTLLIIQVGNDSASTQYVNIKQKRATEIGITVTVERIPDIDGVDLYQNVKQVIAQNAQIDGIMIQLPLPSNADTGEIINLIPPHQDVDGLLLENSRWNTAVAQAVGYIIDQEELQNKQILILGDSPFVGNSIFRRLTTVKPETAAKMHESNDQRYYPQVTVANEFTPNIPERLKVADVVISCIGKPHLYNAKQLRQGAVLIDVGTSPDSNGTIVGDFDVTEANGHLAAYTPVPGGVGPVTVAMLLQNLVYLTLDREI